MYKQTRMIFSDNAVLTDYSVSLNDYLSGSMVMPYTTAQDALYIGSILPFNSLFFDIGSANAVTSVMSISIWWSQAWHSVFDVLDATSSGGKSLAVSGLVSFTPDNWKGWDRWSRNDNTDVGISALNIFDLYWCKITWNATLTGTTAIKYIGQKFSDDTSLYIKYPDLNNSSLKTAFAGGKSTWDEQHFAASEEIIDYLVRTNAIATKDQLLDWALLRNASVHKCAEIIYSALGKDYIKNREIARVSFKEALDLPSIRADHNFNATLDDLEITKTLGNLYR